MSEEVEKVEQPNKTFKDFIGSQEYIDHINGLKGDWGEAKKKEFEIRTQETEKELRKTMRDELMKELNPEETPEQKRIRELEERIKNDDLEKQRFAKINELRSVAKEIGFDVSRADRYYAYGDNAEEYMKQDAEYLKTTVSTALDDKTKEAVTTQTPKAGEKVDDSYDFKERMKNLSNKVS